MCFRASQGLCRDALWPFFSWVKGVQRRCVGLSLCSGHSLLEQQIPLVKAEQPLLQALSSTLSSDLLAKKIICWETATAA